MTNKFMNITNIKIKMMKENKDEWETKKENKLKCGKQKNEIDELQRNKKDKWGIINYLKRFQEWMQFTIVMRIWYRHLKKMLEQCIAALDQKKINIGETNQAEIFIFNENDTRS